LCAPDPSLAKRQAFFSGEVSLCGRVVQAKGPRQVAIQCGTRWPISPRVNAPKNDDPDLLTPVSPDSSTTPAQGPNSL